jgi:hypothetical protein
MLRRAAHRHERHRRLPSDVTSTLGALRNDDVGSGLRAFQRLGLAARHQRYLAV